MRKAGSSPCAHFGPGFHPAAIAEYIISSTEEEISSEEGEIRSTEEEISSEDGVISSR